MQDKKPSRWRENIKIIIGTIVYMLPLFWLWNKDNYPDGFGIHITAHGKAGLLESWWYSYLLIERHRFWDVVLFIYMWAAVIAVASWVIRAIWKDRAAKRDRGNLPQQPQ
ncbi:MAG: hypothetical protein JF595_04165 [Sphingomonadales bacterium]|nr:hypothetical protein [Sphingomonadales bacterium]